MMQFWIGGILLLAFLALPFIARSRTQTQQSSQLELNKKIFQHRLNELKQQLQQQELTAEEYEQLETELKVSLLDDAALPEQGQLKVGPKLPLLVLVGGIAVASVALYLGSGNYRQVAHWQEAMVEMPELAQKLRSKNDTMTPEEIEKFALALRTRLNQDDSDAMGWLLYGRIQLSFGRLKEGKEALENALALEPEHRGINLTYAGVLARAGEPSQLQRAKAIYAHLLAQQPNDVEVLSQQGFALYEAGDVQGAMACWQTMLKLLPQESTRYQQIKQTLAMLKAEQGDQIEEKTQQNVTDNSLVQVQISLEKEAQLPAQGFLVIFVRATQGAPMPMAVKRLSLGEWPVEVSLSNADAMMENYTIGAVEPFEVVAKVVENANVATAESLLEAKSEPLMKADLPVALTLQLQPLSD